MSYDLTIQGLEKCFKEAKEEKCLFIGVRVSVPNCFSDEVIINPNINFNSKLAYYQTAYNEDLTLKSFPQIKITGFAYGDYYDDIELKLSWFNADNS